MSKDKKQHEEKGIENIENTLTKSEQFIEKNQKLLLNILTGILVVIALFWAYMKFYKQPREKEAVSQMFYAQNLFAKDSFQLALNGTVDYPGFLSIIDDYSGTKASNFAKYYAGVCYLRTGDFDNAIKFMKKFSTDDKLLGSEKYGIIGDAYVEKGDYKTAIKFYKNATDDKYANDLTVPIYLKKLGLLYEKQGDYQNALEAYQKIYDKYSASNTARTIQKYIERAKANIQ